MCLRDGIQIMIALIEARDIELSRHTVLDHQFPQSNSALGNEPSVALKNRRCRLRMKIFQTDCNWDKIKDFKQPTALQNPKHPSCCTYNNNEMKS